MHPCSGTRGRPALSQPHRLAHSESRRGPPALRARGPHRCLAELPAATEPVRDRPQHRRPQPAPSDQEMGWHRKSRREHRPRQRGRPGQAALHTTTRSGATEERGRGPLVPQRSGGTQALWRAAGKGRRNGGRGPAAQGTLGSGGSRSARGGNYNSRHAARHGPRGRGAPVRWCRGTGPGAVGSVAAPPAASVALAVPRRAEGTLGRILPTPGGMAAEILSARSLGLRFAAVVSVYFRDCALKLGTFLSK
ncbi:bcl-2-binding component 3, isoforms 3/4-like [Indicator indicator]|uniref:bcl-2-binding component 3, isoforms 3/4-like n=1 Tax=Indicator indicator TaxID=1002788 RepID=UPI0023E03FD4|nr:bcl-2-binding component 3, isoforms 3/4-like [Indicator indicator]